MSGVQNDTDQLGSAMSDDINNSNNSNNRNNRNKRGNSDGGSPTDRSDAQPKKRRRKASYKSNACLDCVRYELIYGRQKLPRCDYSTKAAGEPCNNCSHLPPGRCRNAGRTELAIGTEFAGQMLYQPGREGRGGRAGQLGRSYHGYGPSRIDYSQSQQTQQQRQPSVAAPSRYIQQLPLQQQLIPPDQTSALVSPLAQVMTAARPAAVESESAWLLQAIKLKHDADMRQAAEAARASDAAYQAQIQQLRAELKRQEQPDRSGGYVPERNASVFKRPFDHTEGRHGYRLQQYAPQSPAQLTATSCGDDSSMPTAPVYPIAGTRAIETERRILPLRRRKRNGHQDGVVSPTAITPAAASSQGIPFRSTETFTSPLELESGMESGLATESYLLPLSGMPMIPTRRVDETFGQLPSTELLTAAAESRIGSTRRQRPDSDIHRDGTAQTSASHNTQYAEQGARLYDPSLTTFYRVSLSDVHSLAEESRDSK